MLKVMKTRLTLVVKQLLAEEQAGFSFNKVSVIEVPSCPHHAVRRNAHRVGATDQGIQNKEFRKTSSDLLRRTQNKWSHPLRSLHLAVSPRTPSHYHQKVEADVVQGCRSTPHILKTVLQGYVTTGQVKEELADKCESWLAAHQRPFYQAFTTDTFHRVPHDEWYRRASLFQVPPVAL